MASATRERIEKVAEELGYRANVAASLLSSARPHILGLICSLGRELHVRYHSSILREAQRKDFRVVVESVDDPRDVDRAWESLLQVRTQSVIAADSSLVSQRYSTVPTVLIDQQAPRDDIDLITSAHESGMHEAMTLLRGRGRRRLAFIEGPPGPAARARQTAFIDACRSAELDYVTLPGGDDVDAGFLAVRAGLPAGVDALVCYNDQCAHGAILALLKDGLVPGRDVLVIGCDNSALASSRALALTSIDPSPSRLEPRDGTSPPCAEALTQNSLFGPARDERTVEDNIMQAFVFRMHRRQLYTVFLHVASAAARTSYSVPVKTVGTDP